MAAILLQQWNASKHVGHYQNYAPCGQSIYTWGHATATHPWKKTRSIFMCVQILWFCKYYMSRIHFPAKCSCYTSLRLHVPATRPCHMSPQRVLHTFLSMPHVAATWPLVSGYLYSLKQSSLSSVVCSICDLLQYFGGTIYFFYLHNCSQHFGNHTEECTSFQSFAKVRLVVISALELGVIQP